MDRRRFLAAATGGITALAGCAFSGSTRPTDPEPPASTDPDREPSPERAFRGPAVTARATGTPPAPGPTTPSVATSTETVTSGSTDTPGGGAGGGSGGSGGSGASNPAPPATSTPAGSERSPPIQLAISTVNMDRVVGELRCTAGPLAWMVVEIEFQRAGDPVASERLRRDEPATGETLSFEVESGTADPDRVRITTAYAYPES